MTASKANFASDIVSIQDYAASLQFKKAVSFCDGSGDCELLRGRDSLNDYWRFYDFEACAKLASAGYFIGRLDSMEYRLVGHWWRVNNAKGVVVVAHGLFDHVGIYLKLVVSLLENNFDVFMVDMPGHGLSSGPRAEIDNFKHYADVLDLCVHQVSTTREIKKLYLLGQSTGGAAVMYYLLAGNCRNRIAKVVLLAPLLWPKNWRSVNFLWILLHKFIRSVPRRFATNSNDEVFLNFLARMDPLQPRSISLPWVSALRKWVATFFDFAVNDCPVLLVQGDSDETVDWQHNLPAIQEKFPNSTVLLLQGAKHHLVNESDAFRKQVNSAISDFLNTECEGGDAETLK